MLHTLRELVRRVRVVMGLGFDRLEGHQRSRIRGFGGALENASNGLAGKEFRLSSQSYA